MSLKAIRAVFTTALKVSAIAGSLLGPSIVHASLLDVSVEGTLIQAGFDVTVLQEFNSPTTVGKGTEFEGQLLDSEEEILTVGVDIISPDGDPSATQIVIRTTGPLLDVGWGAMRSSSGFSVDLSKLFWFGSPEAGIITGVRFLPPVGDQWETISVALGLLHSFEVKFLTSGRSPITGSNDYRFQLTTEHASIPEPTTLALLAAGLAGAGFRRRQTR